MPTELDKLRDDISEFADEYLPDPTNSDRFPPKVLHDGLWGTLKLSGAEIAFVDSPLFQRLRQIHQTGCAFYTFPSMTHTRFEHTLGVLLQIQKLSSAIMDQPLENRLGERDIRHLRFAALFHDLGHGPFSHTSEEMYSDHSSIVEFRKQIAPAKAHEILSYLLVQSAPFKNFSDKISEIYQTDIPLKDIGNFIIGLHDAADRYKGELLSGPFDADKIDYIFRDSQFSGLPLAVDLDRLWYTIRIRRINNSNRLAVTHTGGTALEQILFSKMVLYSTVYHHHKVRAADCMFAGIIEYMKNKGISLRIRAKELNWSSPADYLWVTDNEFCSFGFETKDQDLHNLIHDLFFRRLLKRAVVFSIRTISSIENDALDEFQSLAKTSGRCFSERRELAKEIWNEAGQPCLLEQVWVDLPQVPSLQAADETYVLPHDDIQINPVTLNKLFPTGEWAEQYALNKWRGHVFCPASVRDKIGKASKNVLKDKYNINLKPEAFYWCKQNPPPS